LLEEEAAADDRPLEVRLADPNGAFEKIHAKGLIVDDDQVVLGSLNWNLTDSLLFHT
jgi:cardiolipin synthase